MFYKIGMFAATRAKLVLIVAIAALIGCVAVGAGVFGQLKSQGFNDPSSASSRAKTILDNKFGGESDFIFLVQARYGSVDGSTPAANGKELTGRLEADPRLRNVISYFTTGAPGLRSRDGSEALILARVVGDDDKASSNAAKLLDSYKHLDNSAVTVRIGGALGTDVGGQVGKDLALAESIAVPLTMLLLVLAFGSLVSALLPLSVALVAILGTFAELSLLTHAVNVSVFAINLTTALGLGLGIDYALLTVSRFREELAKGLDVAEAVAATTASAGRTVAFSALTVAAALSALLVFPVYFLKSFAYAGVCVTLLSALGALFVLPALLGLLGRRVNSGRVPGVRATRSPEAPFWGRLATTVMRHPLVAAAPVLAVLLLLASPLLGATFGTPDERVLPKTSAAHEVGDALRDNFATAPTVVDVLVSPPVSQSELASYARGLSGLSGVQRADSSAGSFARGASTIAGADPSTLTSAGTQRITLSTGLDFASGAAQQVVRQARPATAPTGAHVLVGGSTAVLIDAKHAISSELPLAGGIIVATTFILLFLFTGSVVQPARALLGNALTLGATLGVMVWIFQDGHLSGLLGFTPQPTDTSMPVLLFCIAFGLSMDYEVFLMSRIKELHDTGSANADAVVHGLARTGRIVSTAAALLAVSFFAFGTSSVSFIQFFGLGTGLAILIDATVVRGILVPAFMSVFGERSWYSPAPLRRLHGRIGLSEQPS